MQPTYLPWLGYLDLMEQVDLFVLLDDVEFSRQSWQQRNRIRTSKGLEWLTIPVLTKHRSHQLIAEAEISDQSFVDRHIRALAHSYSKAPGSFGLPELEQALRMGVRDMRLIDVHLETLQLLRGWFDITTPVHRSSDTGSSGVRSVRVVDLLKSFRATHYVAVPGSLNYIRKEADLYASAGIDIYVHSFVHPEYEQMYKPFMAYASSVDTYLCKGTESASILRAGRKEPTPLSQYREDE